MSNIAKIYKYFNKMNEVNTIMSQFDTAEKWHAYMELVRMKDKFVEELKSRIYNELEEIFNSSNIDDIWMLEFSYRGIDMYPKDFKTISIAIHWCSCWNDPWYRRSSSIWIDAKQLDYEKVFNRIQYYRERLPMTSYNDNISNFWHPFVSQIPAIVFGVENETTTLEECLFMAIKEPKRLAQNLWHEVFEPFANKECADILKCCTKE